MAKRIPQTDLVLEIISRFPNGVSVEEILLGLDPPPSRRTLQYRLSALVKRGVVIAEGKTRGKKFKLPSPLPPPVTSGAIFPLSTDGLEIQGLVTRPLQLRKHVGYHREFLDAYQPNKTYYLPEATRQKLQEWGKTEGERPAGTYARKIFNRLLIDLSWNSSRLEGNTYSLLETERLLELGEAAKGKDLRETQMILNHKAAIEFLVEGASHLQINRTTVLNIHSFLSQDLLSDPAACGALRTISVGIGGSIYLPLDIPQLIEECFRQVIDTAQAIHNPFEQSFFLLVHLPYLQPFQDVNKRVSRICANIPFIRDNLCPLSFIDVPESSYINGLLGVYELNRVELLRDVFVWAYERSSSRYSAARQVLGEPDPFLMKYRDLRREAVAHVVRSGLDKAQAAQWLRHYVKEQVSLEDRSRFIEVVETELMNLHEGNMARFRIRPSEFDAWQKNWR